VTLPFSQSRALLILVFALVCASAHAALSPSSAHLEALRQALESGGDPDAERLYLEAFPSNFTDFQRTFYGAHFDELYPTYEEHLRLLQRLSGKRPREVLRIWLGVATNGRWDADAIGVLQQQLAAYGAENTKPFAQALLEKPPKDRLSIIRFLADVENHHAYTEYQQIMRNLQALGYRDLYTQFARAKQERMRRRGH